MVVKPMQANKWLITCLILGIVIFLYGAYMPSKAWLAQYMIHHAWQHSLQQDSALKPWSWADMHPVMRLSAPKYDQSLIVLAGDTGNVLAFGPGHNLRSGRPKEDKTILISGHRDTHFEFLQHVQVGDQFQLQDLSQGVYDYQVITMEVIDTRQTLISLHANRHLKLVTCYPFNSLSSETPYRLVVELAPI
jgi:sortase A